MRFTIKATNREGLIHLLLELLKEPDWLVLRPDHNITQYILHTGDDYIVFIVNRNRLMPKIFFGDIELDFGIMNGVELSTFKESFANVKMIKEYIDVEERTATAV